MTIEDCVFSANFYTESGAAVYLGSGVCAITGCTFERNYSEATGALYSDGADIDIEGCTFSSHWGGWDGGDLFLRNGIVSIVNTIVRTSNGSWAGLYCGNGASGDVTIAENSPCLGAGEGGADIGAHGIGCETLLESVSWGWIKAMYR